MSNEHSLPFFSSPEIAALRQQLRENSDEAGAAVKRMGVKLHPRIVVITLAIQHGRKNDGAHG